MLEPWIVRQYYEFLRELDFTSLFQKGKHKVQVCMNISRGAHFIFPLANIPIWVVLLGKKMLCGRKFLIILRTEVCSPTRHSRLQIFLPESYWKPYNQRNNYLHLFSALKLLKDLAFILYIVIRHISIQLGLCLFVCLFSLTLSPAIFLVNLQHLHGHHHLGFK